MIAARQIAFGKAAGKKEEPPAYWGLCFTAEEAGSTVAMQAVGSAPAVTLETSFDGEIWEPFTVGETTITLPNVGDKVYFRAGEGGNTALATSDTKYNNFVMAGKIAASGNIMSLLQGDAATYTLANYCFSNLFSYCESLIRAPELPAITLTHFCYRKMFYKCSSLATAPELPTKTHSGATARGAYSYMFSNCTNLSKIKVSLTTSLVAATAGRWVENVSPTGTFICPTALGTNETIKRGIGACPEGWTVINEG